MKIFAYPLGNKRSGGFMVLLAAAASLNACSSMPFANTPAVAKQTEEVQKLQAAEYQDDMNAMSFEDNDQTLGNYYAGKGTQVHKLINEIEQGQPVDPAKVDQALNNSDAEKYDTRPPVPLDDEIGNGY